MADGRFVPSNHQAGDMPCHALCADHDVARGFFWCLASLRARWRAPGGIIGALHLAVNRARGTATRQGTFPATGGPALASIWSLSYRTPAGAMPALCLTTKGNCARFNPPHAIHPNCPDRRSDTTLFPFLSPGAQIIGRAGLFGNLQETSRLALPPHDHTK